MRGESVYERIERDGWKSIPSPHHMRWTDCYRKGTRRAFIDNSEDLSTGTTFYYAVEAKPARDTFGQREWLRTGVIDFDSNTPENLRALVREHIEQCKRAARAWGHQV